MLILFNALATAFKAPSIAAKAPLIKPITRLRGPLAIPTKLSQTPLKIDLMPSQALLQSPVNTPVKNVIMPLITVIIPLTISPMFPKMRVTVAIISPATIQIGGRI